MKGNFKLCNCAVLQELVLQNSPFTKNVASPAEQFQHFLFSISSFHLRVVFCAGVSLEQGTDSDQPRDR